MSEACAPLEFGRAEIAQRRMATLTVVPDFDVLEDGGSAAAGSVRADGAYTDALGIWLDTRFGIQLTVVRHSNVHRGFKILSRRWVVERTFDWSGRFRRLSKDYEWCDKSSEAMVYLASIRRSLNRLAA